MFNRTYKMAVHKKNYKRLSEGLSHGKSRDYFFTTEDINRLVYVPVRFDNEFKNQFSDLDNQQLYNSIMELSDYDAVDAETDINNRNALLLWLWEYASEKVADNEDDDLSIRLNESELQQVIMECVKRILSEAPGSYHKHIMTKNWRIMERIIERIAALGGARVNTLYSNDHRIMVQIDDYSISNKVYDIMNEFGYKYKSSVGGSLNGGAIVFEKK